MSTGVSMKLYTVKETAEMLRCTTRTVHRYISDGILKTHQIVPNSPHLIPEEEIMKALKMEPALEPEKQGD